jgi:D-alanyl-D-alanine carboxypeptidase
MCRMSQIQPPYAIKRISGEVVGDSTSLVPWWSITKTVLAAATLKLAETGAFRLDDAYDDWPFTIRQLLQHTSGLTNYGGPAYQKAVAEGEAVWSVDELLVRRNARQLLFAPGHGWAYSNIGYLFLRQLIERMTGLAFDTALSQLVFEPLCLPSPRVTQSISDMRATLWGNAMNYDPRWVFHGLVVGTPKDAVAFLDELLACRLVSQASLDSMHGARVLDGAIPGRPWTQTGYGLGLMIGTMAGVGRAIGHSGVGHDTVSALYAFPDLPGRPIVAAFAHGTDEGVTEHEAVRLALDL